MPLTRYQVSELAWARKVVGRSDLTPFEREQAGLTIARLEALDRPRPPPSCKWCLGKVHTANDAVCQVLSRFRLKHGRGSFPTDGQAAEIREAIKRDAATKEAAQRRADAKSRQGSLF